MKSYYIFYRTYLLLKPFYKFYLLVSSMFLMLIYFFNTINQIQFAKLLTITASISILFLIDSVIIKKDIEVGFLKFLKQNAKSISFYYLLPIIIVSQILISLFYIVSFNYKLFLLSILINILVLSSNFLNKKIIYLLLAIILFVSFMV